MKKYLKIILFVLALIAIGNYVFNKPKAVIENNSVKGCYVAHLAQDTYNLNISSENSEIVEGTLALKNFEKDSSSGTFKGTYKEGILLGDYTFNSEGIKSVMQVIFKKSGKGFMRGYGDMNADGTRFADINKITYDTSYIFKPIECLASLNAHDGTYTIAGEKFTLTNGISKVTKAPDSVSKTIVKYFGNDVKGDFNNDGTEDIAFIITQETGGSGTFYYVVALLATTSGSLGSDALFLGDRIAPQTMELSKNNIIVVNYAERKAGESFTEKPSVGKSIWLKLNPKTMQFGEVVQDFEGEADPKRMSLGMKTWVWDHTIYSDDKLVKPLSPTRKFTLTFKSDKSFSATTDCNGIGGEYSLNGKEITFVKMMSTLMYCENSQESDFGKMLEQTQSYMFTSKGEMVLLLKYDSGSVIFK